MKASDRKILFGHVLTELRRIAGTSRGLAANMYYSNRKRMLESMNPFSEFINRDRQLVDNILDKLNQIKP
jgi:prephenate dehydrogenase